MHPDAVQKALWCAKSKLANRVWIGTLPVRYSGAQYLRRQSFKLTPLSWAPSNKLNSTAGPTQPPSEKPCNPPVDQPTQQHCIWGPRTKNKLFTLPPKPPRTPDHEELRNPPDLGAAMNSTTTRGWNPWKPPSEHHTLAANDLVRLLVATLKDQMLPGVGFTFYLLPFFLFCGPKMTYVESWHMSIDIPRISLLFMQTSIKYTTVSVGTISKI